MSFDSLNQTELHKARQAQLDKSKEYTARFLKSLDPVLDHDRSCCPVCSEAGSHLFDKNGGSYSYCGTCLHVYLANPLHRSRLIDFYADYPTSSLEWHANESEFYESIYCEGIELIRSSNSKDTLLDIGCSSGFFLSIASRKGFNASGLEPNIRESAYAKSRGVNVLGATLEDLKNENIFDVVTLWDVLEHIREPVQYLKSLKKHLKPDSLVFVQVPSSDSLAARIMREHCNMFDGIEHLTLFSMKSLQIAFEKAGYTLVNSKTIISELYAIENFLNYDPNPYLSNGHSNAILDSFSPDMVESSGLGYKIQAVFRNRK